MLPNFSKLVAAFYLGPIKSLCAYIEGMLCLFLSFTATNSSDLAASARLGISTLFEVEAHFLLLYVLVLPNFVKLVAALYLGLMKCLWAY